MKRAKLMLLSLALVAVVGGALAFKAKTNTKFCTTLAIQTESGYTCSDSEDAPLACDQFTQTSTIGGGTGAFVCTADLVQNTCDAAPACLTTPQQLRAGD